MLSKLFIRPLYKEPLKVFYSYSDSEDDLRFIELLDNHLALLKRNSIITSWHKQLIRAGADWMEESVKNIEAANLILLLVSPTFLASDFCADVEIKKAMERHALGAARLIPILLKPVDWDLVPFAQIQPLPKNKKPITLWKNTDKAFVEIAKGIRQVVETWDITIVAEISSIEWHLKLNLNRDDFDNRKQQDIVSKIKDISNDSSISMVGIREEDVLIIVLIGSLEGYKIIKEKFDQDLLSELLGIKVLGFTLTFGAGVNNKVVTLDSNYIETLPASVQSQLFGNNLLLPSREFKPMVLNGISVEPNSPGSIEFIIDSGDTSFGSDEIRHEHEKLIDYFRSALAIKEDDLWVNLSAYEDNRMIPEVLGGTQLGRVLLSQDCLLKRLAATLTHPDTKTGKRYWKKVFREIHKKYGDSEGRLDTYHKVWIIPDTIEVYSRSPGEAYSVENDSESNNTHDTKKHIGFVVKKHLKIKCESNSLAIKKNTSPKEREKSVAINEICLAAFKEIILPIIEKEVNSGENFNPMVQILNSLILAKWYKNTFKNNSQAQQFIDNNNPKSSRLKVSDPKDIKTFDFINEESSENFTHREFEIAIDEVDLNEKYFRAYMELFKKGVYQCFRRQFNPDINQIEVKSYFSGAICFAGMECNKPSSALVSLFLSLRLRHFEQVRREE